MSKIDEIDVSTHQKITSANSIFLTQGQFNSHWKRSTHWPILNIFYVLYILWWDNAIQLGLETSVLFQVFWNNSKCGQIACIRQTDPCPCKAVVGIRHWTPAKNLVWKTDSGVHCSLFNRSLRNILQIWTCCTTQKGEHVTTGWRQAHSSRVLWA